MPQIILSWVAAGAVAGVLVHLFLPRPLPGRLLSNIVIGITGAAAGGYLLSGSTGQDIVSGAVTWGMLIVSAVAGVITGVVFSLSRRKPAVASQSTDAEHSDSASPQS